MNSQHDSQTIVTKRNLAIDPRRRKVRERVLDLVKQGLPLPAVAQRANVSEPLCRSFVASEVELAARIRGRIRLVLVHEFTMAAEKVIAECETECYEELEVA